MDRSRLGGLLLVVSLASTLLVSSRASANTAPVVTNVTATQIAGTGQVRVTYDCSDADGDNVTARLVGSSDGGTTFDLLPSTVAGDINVTMAVGPGKVITWQAAADYPGRYWTQVVAKVIVTDGPSLSGEMIFVPAGSFTMGYSDGTNSGPAHPVTLSSYHIDKYEVSNADFQRFIDAGGYSTQAFWSSTGWQMRSNYNWTAPLNWATGSSNSGVGWPGFPVQGVSYYEAEAYAAFVGKRLPTEAEWERAARGGDSRAYPWGADSPDSRANFYASSDPYESGTSPTGFFDGRLHPNPPYQTINAPSPVGAYDMAGNVGEWVRDWWATYSQSGAPETDPVGPVLGNYRVVRGGSFMSGSSYESVQRLRTYVREPYSLSAWQDPNLRTVSLGFRCARSAP